MNTRQIILSLFLALVPFCGTQAQEEGVRVPQFGYISYSEVFQQMPEYQKAQEDFAALKAKYDAPSAGAPKVFFKYFFVRRWSARC